MQLEEDMLKFTATVATVREVFSEEIADDYENMLREIDRRRKINEYANSGVRSNYTSFQNIPAGAQLGVQVAPTSRQEQDQTKLVNDMRSRRASITDVLSNLGAEAADDYAKFLGENLNNIQPNRRSSWKEYLRENRPPPFEERPTGYLRNHSPVGQSRFCDYQQSTEAIDREREQPRFSNGYERDYRRSTNEFERDREQPHSSNGYDRDYRRPTNEFDRDREQPHSSNGYDRDYRRSSSGHAPQSSTLQHAQAIALMSYSENMQEIARNSIGRYHPR